MKMISSSIDLDTIDASLKPDEDGVFRGDTAREILKYLLEEIDYMVGGKKKWCSRFELGNRYPELNKYPDTKGYYMDKSGVWVAFDNRGNECFVEEFMSEEIALSWINNEFDVV